MKKIRKNYSLEFKIQAVSLSEQRGNVSSVAEELGICKESLVNWRKLHKEGKLSKEKQISSDPIREELLRLRKELEETKLERYILKKPGRHLLQERRVRYKFIKEHAGVFPVGRMCEVLKVSRSSFYHWKKRKPSSRSERRAILSSEIFSIYHWSRGRYGSPRIARELEAKGMRASRPLVARLMRERNLRSIVKKKFKKTTNSSHRYPVAENYLNQNFQVKSSKEVWVSDITYIRTGQGWLYLTTVIDLFDRKVIGWSLSETMKAQDTSIAALKMARLHRPLQDHDSLIFHSDRGIQYACTEFTSIVGKNITRSMSGKGNCYDNAVAESFFKTLKTELVYQNRYETRDHAKNSVFEYIETFYNTHRRHSALGNLTIKEYQNLMSNQSKNVA
ncbi:MAG: IS3 family transposase [Chryseobacterium taeanense]